MRRESTWSIALIALLVAGCKADHEAEINISSQTPVAVGAFYPLDVSDACTPDPKVPIPYCGSEELASIDAVAVDDWSIARIVRMQEIPEGLRVEGVPLVLYGVRSGNTTIRLATTFDDGSERDVDMDVVIQSVTRLKVTHYCSLSEPEAEDLIPAGASLDLDLTLQHDHQELSGEHPLPLTGEGLTRLGGALRAHLYSWTAPARSGETVLRSPIVRDFSYRLRHYEASELQLEELAPTADLDKKLAYDAHVGLEATVSVDGQRPCASFDLELESRTPEICVGSEGAESWGGNPASGIAFAARGTGRCKLAARAVGAEKWKLFEYELRVGEPPTDVLPCADVACETPQEPCADGYEARSTADGCCRVCLPVPDPDLCEQERTEWDALYETEIARATTCTFDSDCTVTVLVGGCRNYCHVPFSSEGLSPFMSAISEQYYTGCPHCELEEPPECDGPTRTYCEQGACSLAP